ncbi:synergin gamma-like isoform X2 [Acanthaster planci]|uniref:Synergin gamma-like isoform X2 n=1 Tax=Acanthaster planci TaxID=133434 RepID=A0A8B7ZFX7_ACAPL|nr:synergin gamma-like isoform X2 [Acanthaster planci]
MAFRNPSGPPPGAVGYGMLPYHQQMYMPGNMNIGLPGQQQQPRPGGGQYIQQRPSYPGVTPQRYPMMQQGMTSQQGPFQPQMFPGQHQQHGVNMQQPMAYQQQQQVFTGQPQQMAPHIQQQIAPQSSHHTKAAARQQKTEEQAKKERYFQEQQRKLKQLGKVGGKAASVDSLSINLNLDEMFGKGTGGKAGKEVGQVKSGGGAVGGSPLPTTETAEDDGFGDFLQGPTPPANTPQTPESGLLEPIGQQSSLGQAQPVTEDEGFGGFQQGPGNESSTKPSKQGNKGLSLESMMLDSADLTAPSKSTKAFHQKKPLREAEPVTQAHHQQTFTKGKPWSSAENVTSLFAMPEPPSQSGSGLAEHGQALKAGSSIVALQGGEGKGVPVWCMNETNLPLLYHQVLEASIKDDRIETNLLYSILMLSGLDKPVLGRIWEMANQTIPGQLTRLELYIVLGLIALVQKGQQPSIEALHHFREAPLPVLTPKGQSGHQTSQQSLSQPSSHPPTSNMEMGRMEDDFAPFQEAVGSKPSKSSSSSSQSDHDHSRSKPTFGSPLSSDKLQPTDEDFKNDEFSMDSTLKFPKEEENCYIFAGSPADSSSGRSSPLVWDANSIYDKLTCRSQESISSGSLSDRTPGEDEEDDFHDFKSAPKPAKTPSSTPFTSFPSIAPPKSDSSSRLSSVSSAASKQSKFATSGMHSFDSVSHRKGAVLSKGDQHKIDLFHMDFEKVFPKVGRKMASTDDFGSFQTGPSGMGGAVKAKEDEEFGDFTHFKHSASESDLMGMQPTEVDKYAVFRELTVTEPQSTDTKTAMTGDDFDDFKQAEPPKETAPITSSDSLTDFRETSQPAPEFTANFEGAYPSMKPTPPTTVFEPSPALPKINLSPSLPEEDGFADFKQAMPPPLTCSSANQRGDAFSLKADSVSTSSSEDKYSVFKVLGGADDREPPDNDFGDFQTNPPPVVMDSLSVGQFGSKPDDENRGNLQKPVSASDLYGMEFDALGSVNNGSVAMLNLEDAGDYEPSDEIEVTPTEPPFSTYPNSFQSSQNSKLSKIESIDRLDLKTLDLDLTLGRSVEMNSKDRADSFGDFSSAPMDVTMPVENIDQVMQQDSTTSSGTVAVSQTFSSIPLVPSGSSLIGDRYAEVVGNIDDENRHANEWQRCLEKCHEAVKKANNIFNNISSSSVCNEVIKSSEGAEYLTAVIEIYRVACRILTSMNAMGVDTPELQRLQKDIELVWTNLSAFLASSTLMPAPGSFVFKMAILRPEPTNTDRACGVCLLNVDSRSKAFDRSKDSHKLAYGGRRYHATCANLWVNMVDSILPALPLNRLL